MKEKHIIAARYWLFAMLLLCAVNPVASSAQNDRRFPKGTFLAKFPFEMLEGGVVVIHAKLDSFPDSLNFILDTGSGGISLDSTTVQEYKLPISPSENILRGIGSMRKINYVYNRTLHFPGVAVENLDFHIYDYDLLTSVYGIKINGIIGYSLLRRYTVFMDYNRNMLELYKPCKPKYPRKGYLMKPEIAGIPILEAAVEENARRRAKFYFDSGAGLCLLMTDNFEKDSTILGKKKVILTQAEGIGKKAMRLSTVKRIRIGNYTFKKVPVYVFHDDYNVTDYPRLGGMVGNELFRRFNIILNYPDKEIFMEPNTHFADPFDYSYTGLSMFLVDDEIVIDDIMAGSPAEKAGLKAGDKIIAVETNFTGNIQAYRDILQVVGTKPKLVIKRDNELMTMRVEVKSILDM